MIRDRDTTVAVSRPVRAVAISTSTRTVTVTGRERSATVRNTHQVIR